MLLFRRLRAIPSQQLLKGAAAAADATMRRSIYSNSTKKEREFRRVSRLTGKMGILPLKETLRFNVKNLISIHSNLNLQVLPSSTCYICLLFCLPV